MEQDATMGFVPEPGHKPKPEARVIAWRVQERTLGPILRLLAERHR